MNLNIFNTANLFEAATNLFQQLGIKLNSNTTEPLPVKDLLKQHYRDNDTFKTIGRTYFIGIIENTVFQSTGMFDVNYSFKEALQQGDKNYDGLMLFALDLSKQPTRTEISELTRAFNRISQKMPVALVLKYKTGNETCFSIAISERFRYKQNWRQGEKAGKVIILRDIHTETTHAGHEHILLDLVKPVGVTNYNQLHQHWLQVLDVNILNKKFFQDLANWYFWAMDNVSFPDDLEKKKDVRNATNLIRLITRVIFIWFIKEKSLVPNALFNKAHLDKILKDFNKNKKSQNYYHAILQNLFFGTLNQKMDERKFAKNSGNIKVNSVEFGVKNLLRYADLFTISEKEAMQLFKDVPFLNGGLFDCLDKPNEENKILYVDGFSRNPKKQAIVPDYIFFGEEREIDLNDIYGTKNKKYKSRGLINLLESYKFTVAENTPIEEEIALDPELLGKVFENLLASYNPETQTTARKQTGSFYTPREIVNYMVDESLLEYIMQNVKNDDANFEPRLRELISYSETPNPFDEIETKSLIEGINNCKILDPACGSGAYPMGILHKMVHLLQKLDPENIHWKSLQRQKAMEETESAFKIGDKEERGKRLAEINDVFENNASDYGRKLYLIENCIYGIDIQPIAVQISKLRFFISLIIDQSKQATKENFGIRSLPNLETKFVAANTLISLEKPQLVTGNLFLNEIYEKINSLSKNLKDLRHEYFTANKKEDKIKLQKKDKKLREQISNELQKVGHTKPNAQKIASFDPYDQNTFAPWFDPEWMFGLTTGFDIVIGNPPYLIIPKEDFKQLYSGNYKLQEGKPDLYRMFIENTFNHLKKSGVTSFITPNTFLTIPSAEKIRKFLVSNTTILAIVNYDQSVFESAFVNSIVYILKYKSPEKDNFFKATSLVKGQEINNSIHILIEQSKSKLNAKFELNIFSNAADDDLISKLNNNSITIDNINKIEVTLGLQPYHNTLHSESQISNRFLHSVKKIKSSYIAELGGRDVHKYLVGKCKDSFLDYSAELYTKPPIKFFEGERLIIREIVSDTLIVGLTENKILFNKSCYILKSSNPKFSNKYLLAILNSKVIGFYIRNTGDKSKQTLFPRISMRTLKAIPIKESTQKSIIESIVSYILFLKAKSIESSFLERLIDAMIYELYLPEEIKAGGAEVLKHLGNLPELKEEQDEKNLKTIEKVYKELSDPKHPISAALLKLLTIEEVNIIEGRK